MFGKAVGGEAADRLRSTCAARDEIEHCRGRDRANHLCRHVGQDVAGRKPPAGRQPDRHRRIEVAARDVADGVGHRHDREAERKRHADEPDADVGNPAASTALPQPAKVSQNVPMASAISFCDCIVASLICRPFGATGERRPSSRIMEDRRNARSRFRRVLFP